jgi:hypothetical protein
MDLWGTYVTIMISKAILYILIKIYRHTHTALTDIDNPSSHGPFFPRHLTASGRIEPGSSGHM